MLNADILCTGYANIFSKSYEVYMFISTAESSMA